MKKTLIALGIAAMLEVGGDAAVRRGLVRSGWTSVVVGLILLATYGLVVNFNRSIDFGKLMGLYIVVFFLVSQLWSMVLFHERPSHPLLVGGAFIVIGGLIIHAGTR